MKLKINSFPEYEKQSFNISAFNIRKVVGEKGIGFG